MSQFLHSSMWTIGGLLAVLWTCLILASLPATTRIRVGKRTHARNSDEPLCVSHDPEEPR